MIDARDKITGLIRRAIEDEGDLELVTSPGKPTPRGGYDTTWMLAQDGTATFLAIEAAWYPRRAAFTLTGPAVERAHDAFWTDLGLIRSRQGAGRGPLQCRLLVPYAAGDRTDLLLSVLPALITDYRAEATAGDVEAAKGQAPENPVKSLPGTAAPGKPPVTAQGTEQVSARNPGADRMTPQTAVSLARTATTAAAELASYLDPAAELASPPGPGDHSRLLGQLELTVRHLVQALGHGGLTLPPETDAGTWRRLTAVGVRLAESMPDWSGHQETTTAEPHPALRLARTARSVTLEMASHLDPAGQVTAAPSVTDRRPIVDQIALITGHISTALTHLAATPGTSPAARQEIGMAAARLSDCVPDLQVLGQRLAGGPGPRRTGDFPDPLTGATLQTGQPAAAAHTRLQPAHHRPARRRLS